jgi:transcriptional regulator with GAF, ATPase, and Fis domain
VAFPARVRRDSAETCGRRGGCRSVTATVLFECEIFGHERGAFTGDGRQKKGLIEEAEGSTLFLDEIGETSPAIQAKLLRVLETNTFRCLGGTRTLRADVRFVVASNRELGEMSEAGSFRSDLYFRLASFVIRVPPVLYTSATRLAM